MSMSFDANGDGLENLDEVMSVAGLTDEELGTLHEVLSVDSDDDLDAERLDEFVSVIDKVKGIMAHMKGASPVPSAESSEDTMEDLNEVIPFDVPVSDTMILNE